MRSDMSNKLRTIRELDAKAITRRLQVSSNLILPCLSDSVICEKLLATPASRKGLLVLAVASDEHREALVQSDIFNRYHHEGEQSQLDAIVDSYAQMPAINNTLA